MPWSSANEIRSKRFGGRSNRFSISAQDPYFLGSSASLGVSVFFTDVRFEDFEQEQRGFDISQVFQRLDYLRDGALVASRYRPKGAHDDA